MSAITFSRVAAFAAAAAAVGVTAGPALAVPTVEPTLSNLSGKPRHLALGPDGNVWTPLSDSTMELARIAPDGTVTEYDVDTLAGAEGIASDGTSMWATKNNAVVKFAPANPAGAVATPVAAITDPRAITLGSDGNLWTGSGDQVVHFAPANPAGFTTQTVAGMGARGIASGGDGALYIADFGSQRVVRVTTAGVVTFTATGGGPQEVAAGPGTQVAVANPGAVPQAVSRIDAGAVSGTSPMPLTDPFGLVLGNDGAYWVARFAGADVGRIAPDGTVTALALPAASGPRQIAKGPGDTLFVGLETAMKVARVSGVSAPPPPPVPVPPTPVPPVLPPPLPPVVAAPTISGLTVTPSAFRRGTSLPALTTTARGPQIRFTTSAAGTVAFRFLRRATGRSVGGRCVAPTRRNRGRNRCARWVPVSGTLSVPVPRDGAHRVRFQGRISASKTLRPGRYRVVVTGQAGGATSAAATAGFTVRGR